MRNYILVLSLQGSFDSESQLEVAPHNSKRELHIVHIRWFKQRWYALDINYALVHSLMLLLSPVESRC